MVDGLSERHHVDKKTVLLVEQCLLKYVSNYGVTLDL